MSAAALLLGTVRPSFGFSATVFALIALLAGVRMIASSTIGLDLGAASPLQAMSVRAAAMQFGYLGGAALGGIGLMLGGWPGLGGVLAVLLLLAAAVPVPRLLTKVGAR
jgi:MFS transporter, DHA1 family, inner membrane transport protein